MDTALITSLPVASQLIFHESSCHSALDTALLATCFHAGFFHGLFFDPEDRDDMFLRDVGWLSTDYKALYPGR
jgi:hypothetical protein